MKKITLILPLIFWVLISCQDNQAKAELEKLHTQLEVEAQNKATVIRLLKEGDKKNVVTILDEVCHPDYKMYFPSNAEPINLEEHKVLWNAFNTAFPDLKHTIHVSIAEGDKVSTIETFSGTHEGEFQGIPATGNKIEFSGVCMWVFSEGKLIEYWCDADILGLMQQLGMELKVKE